MEMATRELELTMTVRAVVNEAAGVRSLILAGEADTPLPPWEPGAHIDIVLPGGITRQYSLCGASGDDEAWQVAVLREPESRGGSSFIHESVATGTCLTVRGPRNHFPLVDAQTYLLVAGGIGITPILTMARKLDLLGRKWKLLYGGRGLASMAFLEELSQLGGDVRIWPQDTHGLLDLEDFFTDIDTNTAVYCCGPEGLLSAVEQLSSDWPEGVLHLERFAARTDADLNPRTSFEVEAVQSGVTVTVGPDESIADALDDAGVPVYTSCGEGTCGSCETVILDGIPDHRDSMLSSSERSMNTKMMICCSRALSPRLKLDI